MNRRQFMMLGGAFVCGGLTQSAWKYFPDSGLTHPCEGAMPPALSEHETWKTIWQDIRPDQVWDAHVHLVGVGDGSQQTWFNPAMDEWLHPQLKMQKAFYINATCADPAHIDNSSIARMDMLAQAMPAGVKLMLFAFDWHRDAQGQVLKQDSIFHISNQYAATVARRLPERYEWVASIHPYRADAVDALEHAYAHGAKAIKWLPSGMGIDPASARCDAFYRKMAALGLPIISHTGQESAVPGGEQAFGNPLRMRRALEHGVTVVLAHCASDGMDQDLDHGGRQVRSFELFKRLMETPGYEPLLYGDISATTLINHAWVLPELIQRTHWHARLIHGSDYPLPGIMPLTNINTLIANGWLNDSHKPFLMALKNHHPLLYDFALKRLIVIDGQRFSPTVFETRHIFERT
ncbi:MAG TPA: amidohydrolase family protein [Methylophilus sp.]|nr:amidohydrolase family protein [Methylophilus sp.]